MGQKELDGPSGFPSQDGRAPGRQQGFFFGSREIRRAHAGSPFLPRKLPPAVTMRNAGFREAGKFPLQMMGAKIVRVNASGRAALVANNITA